MASPSPLLRARPRRLVAIALAAVAATALLPAAAAAASPAAPTTDVRTTTSAIPAGDLADGRTAALDLSGDPDLLAFTWSGGEAGFEVRARAADGWGDWMELHGSPEEGPDGELAPTSDPGEDPTASAGPAWFGSDLAEVELRLVEGDPTGVVLHAIDSDPVAADAAPSGSARSLAPSAIAPAAVATPPSMVTRAQWGADEGWRDDSGGECDGTPDYVDDIRLGIVHHTVSANDYTAAQVPSILRGIYDFHVHSNGWCDIAYNFFVDRFGTVYEGRFGGVRRPAIGGHASGFNAVSTGVAVIGDHSTLPVSNATYSSLVEVLAFKLGFHGVDPMGSSRVTVGSTTSARWPQGTAVDLPNLMGHRDGNNTACPGQALYDRLPQLRNDVRATIANRGYTAAFTLKRLEAADRYATAARLAVETFGSAPVAYVARGDAFPDALAANFGAGLVDGPVLLSNHGSVPPSTLQTLRDLRVATVRLLGGPTALSPDVQAQLQSAGFAVERLEGPDRYATAAAVARSGAASIGTDGGRRTAFLASGVNFPDALAAGGLVYAKHLPQLLTEPGALPAATASALTELGIQHVIITGGTTAVSTGVEGQLTGLGITFERIGGATRWDTAVQLAGVAASRFGHTAPEVELATGENFPDALTGGAIVARSRSVLLLTPKADLPPQVVSYLQGRAGQISGGRTFGGRVAVDSLPKLRAEELIRGE